MSNTIELLDALSSVKKNGEWSRARRELEILHEINSPAGHDDFYSRVSLLLYNIYGLLNYRDSQASLKMQIDSSKIKDKNDQPDSLSQDNINKGQEQQEGQIKKSPYKPVINLFPAYNFWRLLLLVRIERAATAVLKLLKQSQRIAPALAILAKFTPYLAFLWYVPRLFYDLTVGAVHAVRDRSLDYFRKHAKRIRNDAAWFATGIACLLIPGAFIITVSLYLFDVLNEVVSGALELFHIYQVIKKWSGLTELSFFASLFMTCGKFDELCKLKKGDQEKEDQEKDQIAKKDQIARKLMCNQIYKRKVILGQCLLAIGLFVGMAMMLSPLLPVVAAGACLVLVATVSHKVISSRYFGRMKVNTCDNAVSLLHHKLMGYLTSSIVRLNSQIEILENKQQKILAKMGDGGGGCRFFFSSSQDLTAVGGELGSLKLTLESYITAEEKLFSWGLMEEGKKDYEKFTLLLQEVMDVVQGAVDALCLPEDDNQVGGKGVVMIASPLSQGKYRLDRQGSKELKVILRDFMTTKWGNTPGEVKDACKNDIQEKIRDFINDKPSKLSHQQRGGRAQNHLAIQVRDIGGIDNSLVTTIL